MRETTSKCDICGNPTTKVVFKLLIVPTGNGTRHSDYTHHADVGACCQKKLLAGFRWTKRKTAAEYAKARRAG